MRKSVLISEFMDAPAVDMLRSKFDVDYQPEFVHQRAKLLTAVSSVQALIVRNLTQVNRELLEAAPTLKVVGRLGVGLDNIDMDACAAREVTVYPATGANAHSVAEYATCAAMLLLRGAFQATHATAAGTWQKVQLAGGFETSGKILGVVGFGTIGRMTARMAAGLGMRVIGYDPAVAAGDPAWNAHGATLVSFETLLASADVVTLHVPLEAGTRNLFDAARLAQIKKDAVLINTSRGGIVDESALADALISGHLGGAAIDVFAVEPLPAGSALARAVEAGVPNLVLTPHIAGLSAEANTRVSGMIAAKVAGFLEHHG